MAAPYVRLKATNYEPRDGSTAQQPIFYSTNVFLVIISL